MLFHFFKSYLFSPNLPAPINAGPDSQTKAGNLTIQGNLTTGGFTMSAGAEANKVLTTNASGVATWQAAGGGWDGVLPNYTTAQRNALSLADGLIVYNTTDDAAQIYVSGLWRNIGAKLSLGIACSLDGDCDSTHCIDGVCCPTACTGNCNRCNVAGSLGICTNVDSDCTDICTVCSSGTCIPVAAGLTGLGCTADHYRCDGAGNCTAPTHRECIGYCSGSCMATCAALGPTCHGMYGDTVCSASYYACHTHMCGALPFKSCDCSVYDY